MLFGANIIDVPDANIAALVADADDKPVDARVDRNRVNSFRSNFGYSVVLEIKIFWRYVTTQMQAAPESVEVIENSLIFSFIKRPYVTM